MGSESKEAIRKIVCRVVCSRPTHKERSWRSCSLERNNSPRVESKETGCPERRVASAEARDPPLLMCATRSSRCTLVSTNVRRTSGNTEWGATNVRLAWKTRTCLGRKWAACESQAETPGRSPAFGGICAYTLLLGSVSAWAVSRSRQTEHAHTCTPTRTKLNAAQTRPHRASSSHTLSRNSSEARVKCTRNHSGSTSSCTKKCSTTSLTAHLPEVPTCV